MIQLAVTNEAKKESHMFEEAVIFATNAHAGQKRKGTDIPFIIHPLEVAAIVAAITTDEEMLCRGLQGHLYSRYSYAIRCESRFPCRSGE